MISFKSLTSNIGSELDKLRLTNITIMVIANTITTHGIISASPSFENSFDTPYQSNHACN